MKFTIETDDENEMKILMKANTAIAALREIENRMFRPIRKNGYSNQILREAYEKLGDDGEDFICLLENMFYEIIGEDQLDFLI